MPVYSIPCPFCKAYRRDKMLLAPLFQDRLDSSEFLISLMINIAEPTSLKGPENPLLLLKTTAELSFQGGWLRVVFTHHPMGSPNRSPKKQDQPLSPTAPAMVHRWMQ
jgi:hypothetical protein